MTTLYLHHSAALNHLAEPGHPERADRIRVIERSLEQERFTALAREQGPLAPVEPIRRAHDERYVQMVIEDLRRGGPLRADVDTPLSTGTLEAVLRSVGGALQAVDEVMTGQVQNAFSAMRPPGHHAERARATGFCFFNTVAVAARHAQAVHGAERIAILDWDAHHGNGTQDIFWNDASVLYCSTHEMPLYPGTGAAGEQGEHGTIVNVPLAAGDDGAVFREALTAVVLPRLEAFRPDLILISAGFDAHWRDPLANLNLTERDFGWATRQLMEIAGRVCGGRIVSVLEGGYDLIGLSTSVAAHVSALMEA
ncbi:histone deacetylase family protein [Methylobacterium oxalidis]|uniref:Acetoin utilization protein n=1 Tax=Methylobacterium oxalidis TaxID=944322 RepID=A0A512JCT9_9HYPH|nr:histone deacetylase family protein [Methylobacterium oxalidis]GEP07756.1 acetoin utilization protein [Methylobacterium oxalidis]GJE35067.1 Histone deacetylase-like amidohydrolase [Methylobacterium oxalidis]GLS65802.1 acetoin utilization protein [Methylobacterium oxalidis]